MPIPVKLSGFTILVLITMSACSSSAKNKGATTATPAPETNSLFTSLKLPAYEPNNQMLLLQIDSWIGTPYQYGGNNKTGVDCSGFINNIYNEVYQIKLPRTTSELEHYSKPVKREKLMEGDLVFFTINTKKARHSGIYLAHGYFAHASTSRGVIISNLAEAYWNKYFSGAGRVLLNNQ